MSALYRPEPINSSGDLRSIAREEAIGVLRSQSLVGTVTPRSIPQNAVVTPFVTDLPLTPGDGDEIRLLVDDANGVVWHLRYRDKAPSDYRWEFIGGSALYANVATAQQRSTNSYGALTTAGPTISIPFPGEYRVSHGAEVQVDTGALTHGLMSYDVVGTSADDAWSAGFVSSTALHRAAVSHKHLHGIAARGDLVAKYKSATSNSVTFTYRWMSVRPVRVGRT
jgi:hypothetical protein